MDRTRMFFLGIASLGAGIILLRRNVEATPTTVPKLTPTVYYGVYTGTGSGIPLPGVELEQFENDAGKKVSSVGHVAWWYTFDWGDFDTLHKDWVNDIRTRGYIPLILWQPYNPLRSDGTVVSPTDSDYGEHLKKHSLKRIVAGDFDDYIHTWAQQIKVWGHPIMLRLMHELNCATILTYQAYGQSWCASLKDADGVIINEPHDAVDAWRHIINIFKEERVTNVTWVWSVLSWPSTAYGGTNSISLHSIYPGDDYVDWIGIECYNTDFLPLLEACNSSDIRGIYNEASALSSTKHMLMAEMGANEDTLNSEAKPEWIKNALSFNRVQSIPFKYPRIKAIFYWNDGRNIDVAENLWIESSVKSINAFREVIADYHYGTNDYSNLNTSPIAPP